MASIPIFDGAGGQEEASIRPTRIGPEEPRSPVGETISSSMKELTAVSRQMSYLKDGNDLNAGNLAITNHLSNVKQQLESQPLSQFTTPEAYVQQARQLSDPSKLLNSFSGYSPHVRRMLAANAQRMQDDFISQQTNNAITLGHHKLLYDTDTNLNGYAQAYGQADPTHAELYKKLGSDSIDHAVQLGAMTPQEGAARKQKFNNQLDVASLTNFTLENPSGAGQLLTGPNWNKQFPSLTPEQRLAGIQHAHAILKGQENAANDWLKGQQSSIAQEFQRRMQNGTLTSGWADDQVKQYPELRKFYMAAFGKKPPSEGNYEAFSGLMQQLNDPNLALEDVDRLREQAAAAGLNSQESRAFGDAATIRARGMHSALDLRRRDAADNFGQQLNAWTASQPPMADKMYDIVHGKGSYNRLLASVKADFNNRLAHANSPEEVERAVQGYGAIKDHLPGGIDDKSNKSGMTMPPVGTLPPADASRKYPSLGKIKVPNA